MNDILTDNEWFRLSNLILNKFVTSKEALKLTTFFNIKKKKLSFTYDFYDRNYGTNITMTESVMLKKVNEIYNRFIEMPEDIFLSKLTDFEVNIYIHYLFISTFKKTDFIKAWDENTELDY